MKKRILPVIVILLFSLSMSAHALEQRASTVPVLTFLGTTAYCYADCIVEDGDTVDATLTLYQGRSYVDSWNGSGQGSVFFSGSCTAQSGKSYRLVLTWSINGQTQPSVTVTGTCP